MDVGVSLIGMGRRNSLLTVLTGVKPSLEDPSSGGRPGFKLCAGIISVLNNPEESYFQKGPRITRSYG